MSTPLAALNIALKSNALTLSNMKVNEKLATAFQSMSKDENAKNIKEGFGSLEKAVENGNLEQAAKSLMDFIDLQSAIAPGMKVLLADLKADTTGARMELMQSVFSLIKSQGVQDGLTIFGSFVNSFLGVANSLVNAVTSIANPGLKGNVDALSNSIYLLGQQSGDSITALGAALGKLGAALNIPPLIDKITLAIILLTTTIEGFEKLVNRIIDKLNPFAPAGGTTTIPNPTPITPIDYFDTNPRLR